MHISPVDFECKTELWKKKWKMTIASPLVFTRQWLISQWLFDYSGICSIFWPFEHDCFITNLFITYFTMWKIISKWNELSLALRLSPFILLYQFSGNYIQKAVIRKDCQIGPGCFHCTSWKYKRNFKTWPEESSHF